MIGAMGSRSVGGRSVGTQEVSSALEIDKSCVPKVQPKVFGERGGGAHPKVLPAMRALRAAKLVGWVELSPARLSATATSETHHISPKRMNPIVVG
jgi:hypothetical protein